MLSKTIAAFRKALSRPLGHSNDDRLNEAQKLVASFGKGKRTYKAQHAPQGTPPRLHLISNRRARKAEARQRALVGHNKPQPVKHMHSAGRRRALEVTQ